MKVYCEACNAVEHLTPLEAEKIIYVLEAEQRFDPARDVGEPGWQRDADAGCLRDFLELADSAEGYAEHVEAALERRKASVPLRSDGEASDD